MTTLHRIPSIRFLTPAPMVPQARLWCLQLFSCLVCPVISTTIIVKILFQKRLTSSLSNSILASSLRKANIKFVLFDLIQKFWLLKKLGWKRFCFKYCWSKSIWSYIQVPKQVLNTKKIGPWGLVIFWNNLFFGSPKLCSEMICLETCRILHMLQSLLSKPRVFWSFLEVW